MKPTQTWARQYNSISSYQTPLICMGNLPEESEKMQEAPNYKDSKDTIEQEIKELEQYVPNQNPPTAFIDYRNRIRINISSNFQEKEQIIFPYTKTLEIYAQVEKPDLKDLTDLLTEKGFELI